MVVYLFAQKIAGRHSYKSFGQALGYLVIGAVAGSAGLVGLFAWQGQLSWLLATLPMLGLEFAAIATAIGFVFYAIKFLWIRYDMPGELRKVRAPVWWIVGAGVVTGVILICAYSVYFGKKGELAFFIRDIPFVRYPMQMINKGRLLFGRIVKVVGNTGGYVSMSREAIDFSQQAKVVLGYYKALILPVLLGCGAIAAGIARIVFRKVKKRERNEAEKFWLLLAVWWVLDMGFVWVSPRPYEQYYLPLCASGATLGGYLLWLYSEKYKAAKSKGAWVAVGAVGVLCAILMAQHIYFGLAKSPYSGAVYKNRQGQPEKRRGYVQQLERVKVRKSGQLGGWEVLGDYIRERSSKEDQIYVWGWFPGIYVRAQRFSPARRAFESDMHVKGPGRLSKEMAIMVKAFSDSPPKFIVDTRKIHFPNDRPPLELWPVVPKGAKKAGFLEPDARKIAAYDSAYEKELAKRHGEDEAGRYRAMKTLRDFVMNNYRIVRMFGRHVLFEYEGGANIGE